MIPSLLRLAEHASLAKISLAGTVLDLGGDTRSQYRRLLKGEHLITVVNLDEKTAPDIEHDLEKPLPFEDASYDHVLLINVLEHVFNYRQLLSEATRVVKPGGSVIVVVPFLFPIHPSPHDYWRFTDETLRKECALAGLTIEQIESLGTGVFAARYVALDRLLPSALRLFNYYTARYFARGLDALFTIFAHLLRKKYRHAEYALGYVVTAKK